MIQKLEPNNVFKKEVFLLWTTLGPRFATLNPKAIYLGANNVKKGEDYPNILISYPIAKNYVIFKNVKILEN
jgi:hypothetical protein